MSDARAPGYAPEGRPRARIGRREIRRAVVRAAVGGGAALGAYLFVYWLGLEGVYDLAYARSVFPALWAGFALTAGLIAVIIPGGFVIGFLIGWARTSGERAIRWTSAGYVDFFRSMPPIVLIVFAFVLGLITVKQLFTDYFRYGWLALDLAAAALMLHTAAYQAEIVRAGILSVPVGQTEAGAAIGMTKPQILLRVVFPQALRVSLPALGNEFSSVIKDSSLLGVIGWLELSGIALIQISTGIFVYTWAPIVVWLEIAVLYFLLTFAINSVVRTVENLSKVPGLEATRA